VVIDAGHGGNAPGATKQGINEKDIDLAIVLKVKELFDEAGDESVGVYYTRTDDSNPSLEQRVDMANKAGADLFISVHNNSTKSGRMSSINGTAVMYDEEKASEEKGSMQLAQICLEEMTSALGSTNKGIVKGHEIYIIRTAEMPVALIEVGFMTNQDELNELNDDAYQKEAAQAIYNAIYRAFQEGY
jgi:N-acetylmuramoyl-L-alanine amidase